MISDEKKEEVRAAADIVEVISDYVKLKKSGSGFVGLCPYHNENTPSFHVTPRLGIFKCFGCGESGDVFKFVMDQDGVGFNEAVRSLADRYGIFIPEEETAEPTEYQHLKEGIMHALRFAGLFFYRNLIENPEAGKARQYLEKRGYNAGVFKKFGLGYAPSDGDALWKAAQQADIDEQYLSEGDLIKPSKRGEGFYDTFRDRLIFPIFNPSGKVIAFAGRVLGDKKTAKYINSSQTPVYNKSEVVYGLNFARNEIRKKNEVILVEGYTDVITLNNHGIENVVASSGTSLTAGQMKALHRYGEKITMIYDSDSAGQNAMRRGIDIALAEGMEVELLELPEGEDPDSFVKQFGKESFLDLKKEEATDFVNFLIHKYSELGSLEKPAERSRLISEILSSIAHIPDSIQRQVYVQHLHQQTQQFRKGSDKELFEQLDRLRAELKNEERRAVRREQFQQQRQQEQEVSSGSSTSSPGAARPSSKKKPDYEKELIRLMISYGNDMVKFIGSHCNAHFFEDEELRMFFNDIIERYKEDKEISVQVYTARSEPFPRLVGEALLERHSASERHHEKTGLKYEKDKDPYRTAKSTLKAILLSYSRRVRHDIAEQLKEAGGDQKQKLIKRQAKVQRDINRFEETHFEDLFDDPPERTKEVRSDVFDYKMKTEN